MKSYTELLTELGNLVDETQLKELLDSIGVQRTGLTKCKHCDQTPCIFLTRALMKMIELLEYKRLLDRAL
jgi:hypothetical protein